ncbi:hypothetical protein IEQ44_02300 [Nocardioides sp. Y6]|uniref:Endonuclease/exonuclease/phosphatase domain-containing protein n=1 Tax=Nocardioides malaquae TaxID=2773426 RepID=A0ABR9RPJ6_9ACTN|nr:endonuclease/exonuclease/phosphatase family protein [Nocardioides malaquae]MBE7323484.1 hypothetical protein [Nocardioides malaquae]
MAGAHRQPPRRRAAVSPARRWLPRAVSVSLVVVFVLTGLVLSDLRAPSDSSDSSTTDVPVVPAVAERATVAVQETATEVSTRRVQKHAVKLIERRERIQRRAQARAARLEKERREARRLKKLQSTPFTFTIGSFNVLGSQHSTKGGQKPSYPSASVRTPRAASLARSHGVHILGTQELQEDQLNGLTAQTGMKAYPGYAWGAAETDNSILYDPAVFDFVSGDSFHITFMGRSRPQAVLRLKHKKTQRELYVVNAHPSAGGGKYAAERAAGHHTIAAKVRELRATGLPVLLTGDMNDREQFYCRVVATTDLTASNGGGTGCAPPPQPMPVDWVVGAGVSWSNYHRDTTPVDQKTSDHFFISATATVD